MIGGYWAKDSELPEGDVRRLTILLHRHANGVACGLESDDGAALVIGTDELEAIIVRCLAPLDRQARFRVCGEAIAVLEAAGASPDYRVPKAPGGVQ